MSIPRRIRCGVESITDHGGRVYTVDLAPDTAVPPFKPGQFLHLAVDAYDPSSFWPESRIFSIASSPRDRRRLRICYAVKGRYTTRMEQALKPGSEVWVKLPYGDFVIDAAGDPVLIAGGTGISAFTAFLEALAPETPRKVCLAYGARCPDLLLFLELILDQAAHVPNLQVVFFTEAEGESLAARVAKLPGRLACHPGRISIDALGLGPADAAGRVFYLSGPPVMLSALKADLRQRGVPEAHVRTDAWE
jgi:ferredoxin-NADP reductase